MTYLGKTLKTHGILLENEYNFVMVNFDVLKLFYNVIMDRTLFIIQNKQKNESYEYQDNLYNHGVIILFHKNSIFPIR